MAALMLRQGNSWPNSFNAVGFFYLTALSRKSFVASADFNYPK